MSSAAEKPAPGPDSECLLCSHSVVSDPAHGPESVRETMAERHARMLADAAAHAHRIVCARGQEAVEAPTTEQRAQAERAFDDAARTLRAAIMLEARLARGLETAFRAERDDALERRRRLVMVHLRREIRRAEAATSPAPRSSARPRRNPIRPCCPR